MYPTTERLVEIRVRLVHEVKATWDAMGRVHPDPRWTLAPALADNVRHHAFLLRYLGRVDADLRARGVES